MANCAAGVPLDRFKRLSIFAIPVFALTLAAFNAPVEVRAALGLTPGAYIIHDDPGGFLDLYEQHFKRIARSYSGVVIDGECSSACTTVLTYVSLDRICITPRAWLGFHAPTEENENGDWVTTAESTVEVMQQYPEKIRDWINANGGLKEEMIFLEGDALGKILKRCA